MNLKKGYGACNFPIDWWELKSVIIQTIYGSLTTFNILINYVWL